MSTIDNAIVKTVAKLVQNKHLELKVIDKKKTEVIDKNDLTKELIKIILPST